MKRKYKSAHHTNTLSAADNDIAVAEVMAKQPRVCILWIAPPRKEQACARAVHWLPIEGGTGALICQNHGEIAFCDTIGGAAAKLLDAKGRLRQ